jgi:hypothetical protein
MNIITSCSFPVGSKSSADLGNSSISSSEDISLGFRNNEAFPADFEPFEGLLFFVGSVRVEGADVSKTTIPLSLDPIRESLRFLLSSLFKFFSWSS